MNRDGSSSIGEGGVTCSIVGRFPVGYCHGGLCEVKNRRCWPTQQFSQFCSKGSGCEKVGGDDNEKVGDDDEKVRGHHGLPSNFPNSVPRGDEGWT